MVKGAQLAAVLAAAAFLAVLIVAGGRGDRVELSEEGPKGGNVRGAGGSSRGRGRGRDRGGEGIVTSSERMKVLEEEAKDKSIEANIKQQAGMLERERARQEADKADAEREKAGAIEDQEVEHGYMAKAKEYASESSLEKAAAKVAKQQAIAMGKELDLRKAVLQVAKNRADDERHQARLADQEAHSADERLDAIERKIKLLRRKAEYRTSEAGARVEVGKKLLAAAQKLSVAAKAAQEKALMDKESTKTVSGEALKMIKREAMRVSRLLKSDDEELHAAEANVKDGKSSH